jgi:hypothetical protein
MFSRILLFMVLPSDSIRESKRGRESDNEAKKRYGTSGALQLFVQAARIICAPEEVVLLLCVKQY